MGQLRRLCVTALVLAMMAAVLGQDAASSTSTTQTTDANGTATVTTTTTVNETVNVTNTTENVSSAQLLTHVNVHANTPPSRFYINSGEYFVSGQSLISQNGTAELRLDSNCNLYVIQNDHLIHAWLNSEGLAQGPCQLQLTKKGCLRIVAANGKVNYIGKAAYPGSEYYQLVLTDLARLRIYAVRRIWTDEPVEYDI
eukprot:TRINITY_DN0_c2150_g1_i1.p1 TRINITY_DN0_c2150_g1~~TRINITY_DN0_c2150_g1_i1.p1  ORF type:complete len:198 (-),score=24.67 TRINITY_DN0_c2150_g1_i1:117-710(-)